CPTLLHQASHPHQRFPPPTQPGGTSQRPSSPGRAPNGTHASSARCCTASWEGRRWGLGRSSLVDGVSVGSRPLRTFSNFAIPTGALVATVSWYGCR
ncbi:hypothetical protein BT69DRAFT_1349144, partial [Atractiella rhizophila]